MYCTFGAILLMTALHWMLFGLVLYSFDLHQNLPNLDLEDPTNPILFMSLLFLCGIASSFMHVLTYWIMAQLSSDPQELVCFGAFKVFWDMLGSITSFLLAIQPGYTLFLDYWLNMAMIILLIVPTILAIKSMDRRGIQGTVSSNDIKLAVSESNASHGTSNGAGGI